MAFLVATASSQNCDLFFASGGRRPKTGAPSSMIWPLLPIRNNDTCELTCGASLRFVCRNFFSFAPESLNHSQHLFTTCLSCTIGTIHQRAVFLFVRIFLEHFFWAGLRCPLFVTVSVTAVVLTSAIAAVALVASIVVVSTGCSVVVSAVSVATVTAPLATALEPEYIQS